MKVGGSSIISAAQIGTIDAAMEAINALCTDDLNMLVDIIAGWRGKDIEQLNARISHLMEMVATAPSSSRLH